MSEPALQGEPISTGILESHGPTTGGWTRDRNLKPWQEIARSSAVLPGPSEVAGPGCLIGAQCGNHGIHAIANLARVRSGVVAANEDTLEIDRYRAIARQEGNRDRRQSVLKANRIDEKRFPIVEAMDRHVIVECLAFAESSLEWNGRDMLAGAKKVDLNQVSLARENLSLFADKKFASLLARCLVREVITLS
jgi:hypothetical protein